VETPISRHEFFEKIMRGGLLAGLLGLGMAALEGRREVSACLQEDYCGSCRVYEGCVLPKKKEAPDEQENKD